MIKKTADHVQQDSGTKTATRTEQISKPATNIIGWSKLSIRIRGLAETQ